MFRKFLGLTAAAACIAAVPSMAHAGFEKGDVDITLSGSGQNGPDFDGFTASANGSAGYFLTDALELGIRQTATYSDIASSGNLSGATRVFIDYHFELAPNLYPYIGGNIGYVYGDAVNDTFAAAPEAGIKYFVNPTTYIFGSVEYQFFFDKANQASDNFSDGQFIYGLGIGFVF